MGTIALLLVAVLLPTGVMCAWVWGRAAYRFWLSRRPPAPGPPLDKLHADLRRLHALLAETENSPELAAKRHRSAATRAAYLDVLTVACGRFEVVPPSGRPVPQAEIYRVEADLRRHGLDVRAAV